MESVFLGFKRTDAVLIFPIVNFHFLSSNILPASVYGVHFSVFFLSLC